MMFMDKKLNGCFRNSLAACGAFASEFGRFWYNFVFPGCACRLSTPTNQIVFSAKLRFAFFWKLHDIFEYFMDKKNVFGFLMSWKLFENVLEMVMNSANMNSSMGS